MLGSPLPLFVSVRFLMTPILPPPQRTYFLNDPLLNDVYHKDY